MKDLHGLKECQRLTLPDYLTQVSQQLTKLLALMQSLVKFTESLKLNHALKLRRGMENLQQLVSDVGQAVEDHKNHVELMNIQSRLEITPKLNKHINWKEIKGLNLTAQDRKLRKRGDAVWMGHGKQLRTCRVCVCLCVCVCVCVCVRACEYKINVLCAGVHMWQPLTGVIVVSLSAVLEEVFTGLGHLQEKRLLKDRALLPAREYP